MAEKTHKVRVSYLAEITPKEKKMLIAIAESHGHGFDNPKPNILLKRLFEDQGTSILTDLEKRYTEDQGNESEDDEG
jgi:hypothetical protein